MEWWGWGPHDGVSWLNKKRKGSLSPYEHTVRSHPPGSQQGSPPGTHWVSTLTLDFLACRTWEKKKSLLYKPPSLGCLAMAALSWLRPYKWGDRGVSVTPHPHLHFDQSSENQKLGWPRLRHPGEELRATGYRRTCVLWKLGNGKIFDVPLPPSPSFSLKWAAFPQISDPRVHNFNM